MAEIGEYSTEFDGTRRLADALAVESEGDIRVGYAAPFDPDAEPMHPAVRHHTTDAIYWLLQGLRRRQPDTAAVNTMVRRITREGALPGNASDIDPWHAWTMSMVFLRAIHAYGWDWFTAQCWHGMEGQRRDGETTAATYGSFDPRDGYLPYKGRVATTAIAVTCAVLGHVGQETMHWTPGFSRPPQPREQ